MAELEACPNQECKHPKPEVWNSADEACHVICFECGVAGPYEKTPEDATAAWNALPRTDYDALAKQLAEALVAIAPLASCGWDGDCCSGAECKDDPDCAVATGKVRAALAAAKAAGLLPEPKEAPDA